MMDSTFPGNRGMWRAVNSPVLHTIFYLTIIAWEKVTMILCWLGGFLMARALPENQSMFHESKHVAICALTFSLLMWFVVFLSVGGEWFLTWQSKTWNGQDAAFRMFTVIGIILLFVVQAEPEATLRDSR
jgi:predicted small integral membrane protein